MYLALSHRYRTVHIAFHSLYHLYMKFLEMPHFTNVTIRIAELENLKFRKRTACALPKSAKNFNYLLLYAMFYAAFMKSQI